MTPEKSIKKEKTFTIHENGGVTWEGFNNIYEVIGFIELRVNPQNLKFAIIQKMKEVSENDKTEGSASETKTK